MKRSMRWLVALLALIVFTVPVLADTFYVQIDEGMALSIRDENTNEVLGYVPAGASLVPDPDKSTELAAYVTYEGVSGFVLWRYLTRTAPAAGGEQIKEDGTAAPVVEEVMLDDEGPEAEPAAPATHTITVIGGTIQRANAQNRAEGEAFTTLEVTAEDNIIITAQIPRGKRIDYWIINGVHYDFDKTVRSFRMTNADRDWTFEIVYNNRVAPQTLLTAEQIQAARTGERLVITAVNAQLCHIKRGTTGGGGWIDSFDFTEDYTNRATNAAEQGGQVTAKVKATIPRSRRVIGWRFDETELYPNTTVTWLLPRMLNTSMTYEPIFGTSRSTTTTTTETPPDHPGVTYYTVTCRNCVFSGGGYTNATSGTVPAGTVINVTNTASNSIANWEVNGAWVRVIDRHTHMLRTVEARTITRTINRDTHIVAYPIIN